MTKLSGPMHGVIKRGADRSSCVPLHYMVKLYMADPRLLIYTF